MLVNPYGVVIVSMLLLVFVLEATVRVLDQRRVARELPPELRRLYDPERRARMRGYCGARTRLTLVAMVVDLVALLGFWGSGGFALVDRLASRVAAGLAAHALVHGVVFLGVLVVLRGLLSLPFQVYSTFGIEQRFGFNRTSWRTFVLDRVKGALVGVVLGGPLLILVLVFFERFSQHAWWLAWLGTTLFLLAAHYLVPAFVLPLFYRLSPLPEGELRDRLLGYAQRVGFPLAEVSIVDGSRRSTKANAFFTGFGKHKRVALFDTLVAKHGTDELVSVFAHEVGHYQLRHLVIGLVLSIGHTGLMFYLLGLLLREPRLFMAFGIERPSTAAGLALFGLLLLPLEVLIGVAANALSRRHEYAADRFAARTTGSAEPMILALEKLATEQLAHPAPHPLRVMLEYSHPPLGPRLAALRET